MARPRKPKVTASSSSAPVAAAALITVVDGNVAPSGEVHLADDSWSALCGAGRMRYLFPAIGVNTEAAMCPSCKKSPTVTLPAAAPARAASTRAASTRRQLATSAA